jgi:uncharacterized protein
MDTKLPADIPPVKFFGLTFLLSWLIWIPLVLSHFNLGPLHIPEGASNLVRLFGVLMPAVSALIWTSRAGKGATRQLLRRLLDWRVSPVWWLAAGIVQPALLIAAGLAYNWLKGTTEVAFIPWGGAAALVVNTLMLLIAVLGEEIGWRGVALPALLKRNPSWRASLILAGVWGLWHLPFWLLLETFDQFGWGYIGLNFLFVFPLTVYITWLYDHSHFSLLLSVVCHLTFNIVNNAIMPATVTPGSFAMVGVLEWTLALLVLTRLEPRLVSDSRAHWNALGDMK